MKSAGSVEGSRFYRLGLFAARRRWWVIGAWLVVLVAMVPLLIPMMTRLSAGGFVVPGSQSDRVKQAIDTDFQGGYSLTDLLVVHSDSLPAANSEFRAVVHGIVASLATAPGVGRVGDPYQEPQNAISPDGHTLMLRVGLVDDQDQALKHAPLLDEVLGRAVRGHPITAQLTGDAPFHSAFYRTAQSDLAQAERYALPITLVILLLVFGSLVAAGMPLVVAIVALMATFGIVSALSTQTLMSQFIENFGVMIGLGVGIDYSLFIVSRFRERLRTGKPVAIAVAETEASSGKAVFVSAMTVVLALAGMLIVNIPAFRSIGVGMMLAVALAALAAMTLLPALLSLAGHRIDAISVRRRARHVSGRPGFWYRWAGLVMRRSPIALLICLPILLVLALPARHLQVGNSGVAILAPNAGPRAALDLIASAFGAGEASPVIVVLTGSQDFSGAGLGPLRQTVVRIQQDPEVIRVDSIASLAAGPSSLLAKGGTETLIQIVTRHDPQSRESEAFVDRLRDELPGMLPPGVTAAVGGGPGISADIDHETSAKLPVVIGMVLALSSLLLVLFFRSILLALKAVLMNLLSVLAAYGVLVFVFQDGHGLNLLGLTTPSRLEAYLPAFMFTVLFGLSMDYEVFLLARIRERYLEVGDNTEAVARGLERSAGVITSAAAIMITVFGAFVLTTLVPVKEMGLGLAVAVLIDATIIRIALVPATMRLLGRWNWWLPRWLDRLLPDVSLEGVGRPSDATFDRQVRASSA